MQLIMGISADGYVSTQENDDMKWLGRDDKIAFKLLTLSTSLIFVSEKTSRVMPELPGRNLIPLSTKGLTLQKIYLWACKEKGILIGGQTIAMVALRSNMIRRAHICWSEYDAPEGPKMQKQEIMDYIKVGKLVTTTNLKTTSIETWDL